MSPLKENLVLCFVLFIYYCGHWSSLNIMLIISISDYPNPESFTWEEYLKETKSVAAPVRAFKQRPACGFKRGMRLECVDKRVPLLIRYVVIRL